MSPSVPSRLLPPLLRLARANRVYSSAAEAHRHVAERTRRPRPHDPPRRLRRDVVVSTTRWAGWPVHVLAPRAGGARGAVVHVHGGGWVNEVVGQHFRFAAQVAAGARTTVLLPVHPLVPRGTAGAVVPAVADLVRSAREEHGPVCLSGDSAGGQIALSAALVLRDEHGLVLPRTVLVSPALDLSLTNPGIDAVQPSDPWPAREGTRVLVELWRGDLPVDDPRVSPLAGELSGLGPLTLFCGTRDILLPDARLLAARARAAGVDVELHEGRGLVHVYPLTPTPEGRAARAAAVARFREAVHAP